MERQIILLAENCSVADGKWEDYNTEQMLNDIKRWCKMFNVGVTIDIIYKCLKEYSTDCYKTDEDTIELMERDIIYWDENRMDWICKEIDE
jgi:hypothetical protein